MKETVKCPSRTAVHDAQCSWCVVHLNLNKVVTDSQRWEGHDPFPLSLDRPEAWSLQE